MQVKLINHTPNALALLLYTKNTRLQGEASSVEDVAAWPMEKQLEHLAYMRDTIRSSWEFVNYVFEIKGVSRAFTHQLVRTRTASYAQESQRTVKAQGDYITPKSIKDLGPSNCDDAPIDEYNYAMASAFANYEHLIESGVKIQDARGVLPTNIATSIIMGANLRTLSQMAEVRLCKRTQGEYQDVFKTMRQEVLKVHPWAEGFILPACASTGVCYFPRYTECPLQPLAADTSLHKHNIAAEWERVEHEAHPTADGGRTMGKDE